MVSFTVNGRTAPLGTIRSGIGFTLTNFPDAEIAFSIQFKGQTIKRTVNVNAVIREALNFIDNHCANSKNCNDYFSRLDRRNSTTLRRILDEKNLQIFRLGGKDDKDLPAGYTLGWGPKYAQIGLNRISLTDSGNAAAVLLHELAHVAGAPGKDEDSKSLAAETALKFCGLKTFFDEKAVGVIESDPGHGNSQKGLA
jgi:hypothetical protein